MGYPLAFPTDYDPARCVLVPVPLAFVPFVRLWFVQMQRRSTWSSEADYRQGYQVAAQIEAAMMSSCLQALVESNERLYRLLDTTLNGTEYTAELVDDQVVISPAIPTVPSSVLRSIHSRLERLEYLLDNAYNGAEHAPDFMNTNGVRIQLEELIKAIRGATEEVDEDALITQIRNLLA